MNNNLHWAEKVMEGLDDVKKVMPDESFMQRMEDMALAYVQEVKSVPLVWIYSIAASFALLVVMNVAMLNNNTQTEQTDQNTEVNVESSYLLVPANSIL